MKVVVVGGGPAGRAAALELAGLEEDVTLIEKNLIGGTCLNEGCMVVCGLNDVSRFLNDAQNFQKMGIIETSYDFDYKNITNGVKETLNKIRHVSEKETLEAGIELIYSEAEIHENHVSTKNQDINYDKLIIATGGRPFIPPVEGAEKAITYKNILDLTELPEKLVIVGSGIIASEFAGIFSSMGTEVHILARSKLLGMLNQKTREYISQNLLGKVEIHEDISVEEIHNNGVITNQGEIEGLVLLATGMVPNSELMGNLVKKGPRGHIVVNDKMETSSEGIYAAGDVIDSVGTTPSGRMEGVIAARNAVGIESRANYDHLAHSISLAYDVAFLENRSLNLPNNEMKKRTNKPNEKLEPLKNENIVQGKIPGSAGPGSFWRVLTSQTGFSEVEVDLESGHIKSALSISPSARHNLAYLSLLSRLGLKTYDFDKFVETHPSTDSIYKLMRFFAKY